MQNPTPLMLGGVEDRIAVEICMSEKLRHDVFVYLLALVQIVLRLHVQTITRCKTICNTPIGVLC
jgi:hypothetical protein